MYDKNRGPLFFPRKAANKAMSLDLTSAAVGDLSFVCMQRCQVSQIKALVDVAVVSTGAVVITVRKRPTPGSASGQSTVGTLSIPAGTAAGKVYYKAVSPVSFAEGDEMVFEVTTAAAGGSAAGSALAGFYSYESPEVPLNESDMVASA